MNQFLSRNTPQGGNASSSRRSLSMSSPSATSLVQNNGNKTQKNNNRRTMCNTLSVRDEQIFKLFGDNFNVSKDATTGSSQQSYSQSFDDENWPPLRFCSYSQGK